MTTPFVPTGIDHIVIWVGDLSAAERWYKSVLGCRDGYAYPDIAMTHLWHGPVLVGLWDYTSPKAAYAAAARGAGSRVHHVAFGWQGLSVEDMKHHLDGHGVAIQKEIKQVGSRGYGTSLYFEDPWDNLIELKGPAEFQPPSRQD